MNKMHIAFLTPEYPHNKIKHSAGLGTSIGNLSKSMVRQDHKVFVFVYGQDEDGFFEEDGLVFYLIADKPYKIGKWYFYRKYIEAKVNVIVKEQGIDILEVPDWTGISAFMKFSIPVVMRFHGSDTYFCHLEKRKQKWKNRWFEQLAVNGAQAFIAPTQFAGDVSKQLFNIQNKEIATIHHGLELKNFQNASPAEFENGLILYIGTLIRKKGVLELPVIFKLVKQQFSDARMVLIGSDAPDISTGSSSTWDLFKQQLDPIYLKDVSYLGQMPYDQVQQAIRKAHVCVFPTFAETLGMVTIESMALQKPVVNSNIGWAQELMEDKKSGFLVDPKNHEVFSDKIVMLLKDENLCFSIGNKARELVEERFNIEKLIPKNIDFYRRIINQSKA